MAVNPRLAYAIGRPDHAIGYRTSQIGGARTMSANSVVHGGGIGRGAGGDTGGLNSTVNISLGISAVLVAVLVGLYVWADKGSK